MIGLLLKVLLSYMLGSVSGSMLVGSFRKVDIRKSGSGNAGGTNAFRTQGLAFALAVVIIDIGKGVLATWLFPQLDLSSLGLPVDSSIEMLACGFAAVVGHCYPLWHGFRGGKGAATAVGALLTIQPLILVPMFSCWLIVLVITGWVGLATMLAALSLIPSFYFLGSSISMLIFAVILGFFIVFTHRSNIRKIREGTEHRFEKVRVRNWFSARK
jgi:glycerol-3-phosphate acyltransferase PlsY